MWRGFDCFDWDMVLKNFIISIGVIAKILSEYARKKH